MKITTRIVIQIKDQELELTLEELKLLQDEISKLIHTQPAIPPQLPWPPPIEPSIWPPPVITTTPDTTGTPWPPTTEDYTDYTT